MKKNHSTVDEIIADAPDWAQPVLEELRQIMLNAGLKEAIKWGGATYINKKNVIAMGAFKDFVSVWFFEGVHLSDPLGVLVSGGEKTRAQRQWRIPKGEHFDADMMLSYVLEAKENDAKGVKTAATPVVIPPMPDDLREALEAEPEVQAFFESLAPSHRREYIRHIIEAKKEETRLRRLEKCMNMMRQGLDMNARYRK